MHAHRTKRLTCNWSEETSRQNLRPTTTKRLWEVWRSRRPNSALRSNFTPTLFRSVTSSCNRRSLVYIGPGANVLFLLYRLAVPPARFASSLQKSFLFHLRCAQRFSNSIQNTCCAYKYRRFQTFIFVNVHCLSIGISGYFVIIKFISYDTHPYSSPTKILTDKERK